MASNPHPVSACTRADCGDVVCISQRGSGRSIKVRRDPNDARCVSAPTPRAWDLPQRALEAIRRGCSIEILYVHLPFAPDLEAELGTPPHERLLHTVATTLHSFLESSGFASEVLQWSTDDVVAWVTEASPDARPGRARQHLELSAAAHLREALETEGLPGFIVERLDELSVARKMLNPGELVPWRAYARALRDAQHQACDPVAQALFRHQLVIGHALRERAFCFHYQPIVDAHEGAILAYEALCRGTHDNFRFPDVIFDVAEKTDRVWDIGRVLRSIVADTFSRLVDSEDKEPPLLFINVHPLDLEDPVFLEQTLSGTLSRFATNVVIELTERAAIRDYRRVKAYFETLRRKGYRLAIDDLGSGYAGLTALAELEPDFIKFDMGLVRDLHLHPVKCRLIKRVQEFANEIGALTISEGVEIPEERDALMDIGCSLMQGYYFARPAPNFVEGIAADRFRTHTPLANNVTPLRPASGA